MTRSSTILAGLLLLGGCENNQKTPTPPPAPDLGLTIDSGPAAPSADAGAPDVTTEPEETLAPIAENLIAFIPETLDGVSARRRQAVKSAPIVHGYYPGEKRKVYNLNITGPNKSERERREMYPLLGKDESTSSDKEEVRGFQLAGFDAQRTYEPKKKKAETVVLVNPFVEVRLTIAPTDDKEEATKLLQKEVDLVGVSKLR